MDDAVIRKSIVLTPSDTTVAPAGVKFAIAASVAGNVAIRFRDGDVHVVPVPVGYTQLPFAVAGVNTTGTTATAVYSTLL